MTAATSGDALLDEVARALLDAPGPVYVGFSGGLDSTVLLHVAARAWRGAPLIALHVNHGLQPGADGWEQHCARVAAGLGVDCVARRVRVERRGSLEAAARAARYAVFAEALAAPGSRLLLAHHRDDQAETVLLRLLQGRGLYGMPAERQLGAGVVMRPLLRHPRSALEHYARAAGLEWLDDPSNADLAIDRNFVRRRVLPELRARFPTVDTALLGAMAARQAEDALLLNEPGVGLSADTLPLAALLGRTGDEQQAWLRLWLAAHGRAIPSRSALREFLDQLAAARDRQPRLELDRGAVRRYGERLWLLPPQPELAASYPIPASGCLQLPHGILDVRPDPAGFVCDGPLEVRFRGGGERIRSAGRHRLVKQLFQAGGVPPWLRPTYPLVFDAAGLVAVPGLAARDGGGSAAAARFRAEWRPAQ